MPLSIATAKSLSTKCSADAKALKQRKRALSKKLDRRNEALAASSADLPLKRAKVMKPAVEPLYHALKSLSNDGDLESLLTQVREVVLAEIAKNKVSKEIHLLEDEALTLTDELERTTRAERMLNDGLVDDLDHFERLLSKNNVVAPLGDSNSPVVVASDPILGYVFPTPPSHNPATPLPLPPRNVPVAQQVPTLKPLPFVEPSTRQQDCDVDSISSVSGSSNYSDVSSVVSVSISDVDVPDNFSECSVESEFVECEGAIRCSRNVLILAGLVLGAIGVVSYSYFSNCNCSMKMIKTLFDFCHKYIWKSPSVQEPTSVGWLRGLLSK